MCQYLIHLPKKRRKAPSFRAGQKQASRTALRYTNPKNKASQVIHPYPL